MNKMLDPNQQSHAISSLEDSATAEMTASSSMKAAEKDQGHQVAKEESGEPSDRNPKGGPLEHPHREGGLDRQIETAGPHREEGTERRTGDIDHQDGGHERRTGSKGHQE